MPEMPLRPTGGTQTHPGRARKQNWILQYTNTKGAFIFWNSYVKFVKKTKLEKKSFLTLNYQTTPAKKRRTKRLTPFKDHPSAQVLINWGTMLHEILVSFHRLSKKIHFAKSSLQKPRQGVFPVSPTCLRFCQNPFLLKADCKSPVAVSSLSLQPVYCFVDPQSQSCLSVCSPAPIIPLAPTTTTTTLPKPSFSAALHYCAPGLQL